MASDQHSPEPWRWKDGCLGRGIEGGQGLRLSNYPYEYSEPADQEFLRRVAACLNALAGVPTELVEKIANSPDRQDAMKVATILLANTEGEFSCNGDAPLKFKRPMVHFKLVDP